MQPPSQTEPNLEVPTLEAAGPEATESFADDLKPGTTLLNGQYTILGFLNSGGFGITYLAQDSLDRKVVIKECFPNALCRRKTLAVRPSSRKYADDLRSFVQTFIAEARNLAKLVHPNIVGVHQVFEDNDTAYMAIDFVDGKDLEDILSSTDQAFTPAEIVVLLQKMLSAADFIHQAGILHRDISPDNILIDRDGNPVLIDFGAASQATLVPTRVLTGRRVVKDGYSPQEFYLTGAEQSPASDLYSLGATFYHVITGAPPVESQRRLARIAEGAPDPYQPLAGRYPAYPEGMLTSIDKALRVLQKDRLQSASVWADLIFHPEADPSPAPATAEARRPKTPAARQFAPVGILSRPVVADNMGYMIGAGIGFAVAALGGLWWLLR